MHDFGPRAGGRRGRSSKITTAGAAVHHPPPSHPLPAGHTLPDNHLKCATFVRVLLADDDAFMRLLYEEVLRSCGHEALVATDGTEAWAIFERDVPPLVILDWQMPGPDGLEV